MENEVILKRAIIGGFDRRQVMEYIAYLQSKSYFAKEELEELNGLKTTVAELEAEINEKDNMIDRLNTAVAEAESNTRLSRASATLMKESVAYADCYIESAKVLAHDISEKTYSRVEDARDKIDGIMDSIGSISDSILGLYTSMDELKTEYEGFGGVYPETEINVIYPEGRPDKKEPEEDIIEEVAAPEEENTLPSEEDMTDFLRRMEAKYRSLLNS